jgi:hypothetical protein
MLYRLKSRFLSLATGYGLNGKVKVLLFHTISRPLWGLPSLLFSGYRLIFPGEMRRGREAGHSPLSYAEVKNVRAIPPLPLMSS